MEYRCTVYGFDSGLNELLSAQTKRYDKRTKKMVVCNPVKAENDKICLKAIWRDLHDVKLKTPVSIHYIFFVKDKKRDRMNVVSAFDKSFQDGLQLGKCLQNDGFNDVIEVTWEMYVDAHHPRVEVKIKEREEK